MSYDVFDPSVSVPMAHGLSQPVQLAVTIVVALVVIVVTALGSYVLGSFLLMAGHTERRALGATLRGSGRRRGAGPVA